MHCNLAHAQPVRMIRSLLVLLLLAVAATGHSAPAQVAPDAQGRAAPPTSAGLPSPISIGLESNDLNGLPRSSATVTVHEAKLECEGVPLIELLRKSGLVSDPLRGAQLTRYVLATGRDGYRAVYALAEFDPSLHGTQAPALVVDRCNGKALDDTDGPLRLLFPADQRPARWIRQLQSINVIVAP